MFCSKKEKQRADGVSSLRKKIRKIETKIYRLLFRDWRGCVMVSVGVVDDVGVGASRKKNRMQAVLWCG